MIHKTIIDQVQEKLQKLLESDWNNSVLEKDFEFEVQTDLSPLETLSFTLPEKNPERIFILFTRMCSYFESGLLFYFNSVAKKWEPQAAFQKGQYFPLLPQDLDLSFPIEPGTINQVRRVNSELLRATLTQMNWLEKPEHQVFTLYPHPQFCFLVSTNLPDLWLKNHLEKINTEIVFVMADEI